MLTFKEYLQHRDTQLYQELLAEAGFIDTMKDIGRRYVAPAAMALGSFVAQNPAISTGTAVASMAAVKGGKLLYDYVKGNPIGMFKSDEILLVKQTTPLQLMMLSRPDTQKFSNDFKNLQPNPQSGLATQKDEMNKPITMIVVTDEALSRVVPNAGGFASEKYIVVPKAAFTTMPTKSTDGEVSDLGKQLLSHEGAHTTQNQKLSKGLNLSGELDHESYMKTPAEMGVRLAVFKNYMSPETLGKLAQKPSTRAEAEANNAVIDALPSNEVELARFVLDTDLWVNKAAQSSNVPENELKLAIGLIKGGLSGTNRDIQSLLSFIDSLQGEEKQQYIQQLLDSYHNVVRDKQPQDKSIA